MFVARALGAAADIDVGEAFCSIYHRLVEAAPSNGRLGRRRRLRRATPSLRLRFPCRRPAQGIPQGCRWVPSVLTVVLKPWAEFRRRSRLSGRPMAYLDNVAPGPVALAAALARTADFDRRTGSSENPSKRQSWGTHPSDVASPACLP